MPVFLASANLKAFLGADLVARVAGPLEYQPIHGGRAAWGYPAVLLPEICKVIINADQARVLHPNQQYLVEATKVLLSSLATVGVIALVDEATGYQASREKDALFKILETYIARGLLPWTRRFPPMFFDEIYRLYGWKRPVGKNRPQVVGKMINKLIYEQLPLGILQELQEKNPVTEKGHRQHKHHQFLAHQVGHPHLDRQIAGVLTLMRVAETKEEFFRLFEKAYPPGRDPNAGIP